MEPYPLADAPPPRYAVESDDEDEYNPLSSPTAESDQPREVKVEFRTIYDIPSKRPLVFASGEAGLSWAKTVDVGLGKQRAGVYVNKLPTGLLFCPSWTNTVVVVSETETRTRLPLFAMTAYTKAIIERLQPSSVAILDSYPTKMYISPRAISQENAPIRYLSAREKPVPDSELELFAPPNLLQSTTASLLNELFLRSLSDSTDPQDPTAIILLPSSKVPPPPPATLDRHAAVADFGDAGWDGETLAKAHAWLFAIVGQEVDGSNLCAHTKASKRSPVSSGMTRAALGVIGEGGMYI